MKIVPIHTRIIRPPHDDLLLAIEKSLSRIPERSILVITSKVVSIWQGKCVSKKEIKDKNALVRQEADYYFPRSKVPGRWIMHTMKRNLFLPMAGIDESNANGFYILWPDNPPATAKKLHQWLKKRYSIKQVGVIITDSHTIPLRRGVIGISLAHAGFLPLNDYREKRDLFGRKFFMTQTNVVDGIAASAVTCMGEGNESTPLALVTDVPFVRFGAHMSRKRFSSLEIPLKEDLYAPFLSSPLWKKGGGGYKRK